MVIGKMNSIRYYQLMKILGYKIPIQKSLPGFIESSLARVTSYLAHESKVRCLELFTPDVLYGYLRYHMASDFQQITFVQAVKDLKAFVLFLKNTAPRNRIPDSIYNFSLDTISVVENLFPNDQIESIAKDGFL